MTISEGDREADLTVCFLKQYSFKIINLLSNLKLLTNIYLKQVTNF